MDAAGWDSHGKATGAWAGVGVEGTVKHVSCGYVLKLELGVLSWSRQEVRESKDDSQLCGAVSVGSVLVKSS